MAQERRPLSDYGRWLKLTLASKDMTASRLSELSGVDTQSISKIMRGYFPGWKYRADLEKALGESPPDDIAS